jgi:hypothetical protein
MQNGGPITEQDVVIRIWLEEPEPVKRIYDYDFDKYYESGKWISKVQEQELSAVSETAKAPTTPLPETPPVDPKLVSQMVNTNVMQTGLTPTEMALLSNEEKVIRLRQRGIAQ